MPTVPHSRTRAGRVPLLLAFVCFGVYAADIVMSKLASLGSFAWPYELGGVSQFLIVLTGSALLVAAALIREAGRAEK